MKSRVTFFKIITHLLVLFLLISCNKEYTSSYGYDRIRVYEYTKKPLDSDAGENKIYRSELSNQDSILYPKIEKLNFTLIDSLEPNQKIDSILFKGKYEEYIPSPECPGGNNHILLFHSGTVLKYVVKLSAYCDECFIINYTTRQKFYMKIGYDDFMKKIRPMQH